MAKITFNIYGNDTNNDNFTVIDKIDSLKGILGVKLDILNRTGEIFMM